MVASSGPEPAGAAAGKAGELPVGAAPGRNDPCPCGSGRKYKRCHGDPRNR
jgi:preprotein translocase subunit SecA